MIASYISGRLGNQMFQYAYSRYLKYKRGDKDEMVLNFGLVESAGHKEAGFEDSLKYFSTIDYETSQRQLFIRYGDSKQKMIYLLFKLVSLFCFLNRYRVKMFSVLRKNGMMILPYDDNHVSLDIPRTKNVITYGKFENPLFFNEIKTLLQKEFTPKHPPLEDNKDLYEIIRNRNSVCVTIRRGDFLDPRFKDDFYICDEQYFQQAFSVIQKHIKNPILVFFSDDIEWCRENIKTDLPKYYESGKDPVWEKLRLMYSCKHFIISNSTFSWWAQYLGSNDNKIVISPNRWYNDLNRNIKCQLISPEFIKVC